ncbi:RpiB/LacA/LacB family sugar-phosphate isomerase [Microbacterium hominis]|uniref:RpiB/LacA/LacB family sugar-phosphate isomerase n=1 Tax=Microbacterium hominis TaxID=162426 RepID=A0A7D4PVB8_9MICO|nr:RpiB/LacA/LacB family sugar-phosphate isomerase [Microbacterium hominis]QKJ20393.1 RpiB/LacA/LacB family sugar-phosphate isomerase [Microbacterium hominis]
MTRIHFAADSSGYELGRSLEARARAAGHEVVWHGSDEIDPGDDYPIYAIRVGQAVVTDQDAGVDAFGVLVVDEGAAGIVAANKVNGARAVGAASPRAAAGTRAVVDANVLVLEGIAFEENAWLTVAAFVTSSLPHSVDRGRQILQIEEYENSGTIEGWAVQLEPEQIAISHE